MRRAGGKVLLVRRKFFLVVASRTEDDEQSERFLRVARVTCLCRGESRLSFLRMDFGSALGGVELPRGMYCK